ncbi:hypothetical protein [Pseudomonas sp. ICMP 460]|uniref:hypothetical protein n=1 Tax=Pseudomonas sp. ICMP 460 TaxID=1718917 RepID=UPI000C0A2EF5|nr:hypothetical protein AO240_20690 [Pseudomonas sp. ICMP 460]
MTTPMESTTAVATVQSGTCEVLAGPWPNYSNCRHLSERDRWEVYAMAKASRGALEDRGVVMTEGYDAFIARVTRELDI